MRVSYNRLEEFWTELVLLMLCVLAIALVALVWLLAYYRLPAPVWTLVIGALLAASAFADAIRGAPLVILATLFAISALLLNPSGLRRVVLSRPLLKLFRRLLPSVSQTEREALEAGTVWWDGDVFSGRPDWNKLLGFPAPRLTPEERAFIDGPVDELCAMLDDWEVTHELYDLPARAWAFIRERGFLGIIIPKE
jgi:acyl-CoA dehydrogenase